MELGETVCRIGIAAGMEQMKSPRSVAALEKSLQLHLARPIVLQVEVMQGEAETPARQQQKVETHRQESAQAVVEEDPIIRQLVDSMDGRVVPGSIQIKSN
jgi:hypothetical protein